MFVACSKRAKNLRERGKVWKRLNQIENKPRQDQLQELRDEVLVHQTLNILE